jgi:hypothetical protein
MYTIMMQINNKEQLCNVCITHKKSYIHPGEIRTRDGRDDDVNTTPPGLYKILISIANKSILYSDNE